MNEIKSIIIEGRKESEKQNLFKFRDNKIEFDMTHCANRVKEIREEIEELKEDAEYSEDNTEEIKDLKKELKSLQRKKKDLHERQNEIIDEEDHRRSFMYASIENYNNATISTKSTITSPEAPLARDIEFSNKNKSNGENSEINTLQIADIAIDESEYA